MTHLDRSVLPCGSLCRAPLRTAFRAICLLSLTYVRCRITALFAALLLSVPALTLADQVTYEFDFEITTSRYFGSDPEIAATLPAVGTATGRLTYDRSSPGTASPVVGQEYVSSPARSNGIQIFFENGVSWSSSPTGDFTAWVINREIGSGADVVRFFSEADSTINVVGLLTDFIFVQFSDLAGNILTSDDLPQEINLSDWPGVNNIDLRAVDDNNDEYRVFGTLTRWQRIEATAAILVDDQFDDGNIATNTLGLGTGFSQFTQVDIGNPSTVTESGGRVILDTGPDCNFCISAIASNDTFDFVTPNGVRVRWSIVETTFPAEQQSRNYLVVVRDDYASFDERLNPNDSNAPGIYIRLEDHEFPTDGSAPGFFGGLIVEDGSGNFDELATWSWSGIWDRVGPLEVILDIDENGFTVSLNGNLGQARFSNVWSNIASSTNFVSVWSAGDARVGAQNQGLDGLGLMALDRLTVDTQSAGPLAVTGPCPEVATETCFVGVSGLNIGSSQYDVTFVEGTYADTVLSNPGIAIFDGDLSGALSVAQIIETAFRAAGFFPTQSASGPNGGWVGAHIAYDGGAGSVVVFSNSDLPLLTTSSGDLPANWMDFNPITSQVLTPVYSNDFDGIETTAPGVSALFGGSGVPQSVLGYSGLGNEGSNIFSGDFLRNITGGDQGGGGAIGVPGDPTVLTLSGLPPHTGLDLNFLFAKIGTWDGGAAGDGCAFCHPDVFEIIIDGEVVFSESIGFVDPSFVPSPSVLLTSELFLGFTEFDSAYDMGALDSLGTIPHSGDTVTIEWRATGDGWQGGEDESWAIDNIDVVLTDKDTDGDDVLDAVDNCPSVYNPDQLDSNGDEFGDACVDPSVTIPDNADVDPTVTIGENSTVDQGVVIEEGAQIGSNTSIDRDASVGADAIIGDNVSINRDVTIEDGVKIGDGVILDRGVFIGANAVIGSGAMIGRDSVICADAEVAAGVSIGRNGFVDTSVLQGSNIGGSPTSVRPAQCSP